MKRTLLLGNLFLRVSSVYGAAAHGDLIMEGRRRNEEAYEKDLEKADIILNRQLLPGDIKAGRHYMHPGGVRIGVPETTRLGMKEGEMKEIASFIKRVVVDRQEPAKVAKDVAEFRKQFQRVQYAFENAVKAYEYISLTGRK